MRIALPDSQQALNFLQNQLTYVEPLVERIRYPEIIYPQLVPIDYSGDPWIKSITYYYVDEAGRADWVAGTAGDIPLANVNLGQREQGIEMAGIGYQYNLEELGQFMQRPGTFVLTTERAAAAKRAYERFMDVLVRVGDSRKGITGLINNPTVTRTDAIQDGSGSGAARALWANKTSDQILRDVQSQISAVHTNSNTVEMADTILLPVARMQVLADRPRSSTSDTTILSFLMKNNMYTYQTGNPLMIRGMLDLDTAGSGGTARMITYRRDPSILKLNVPMEHRFLEIFRRNSMTYEVPGIFRTGGLQIRRPAAVAYLDGF